VSYSKAPTALRHWSDSPLHYISTLLFLTHTLKGSFRRPLGITSPVLLRLITEFYQLGRDRLGAETSIGRNERELRVRAACVYFVSSIPRRRGAKTSRVVRLSGRLEANSL
jgi:hypothetical protein